jgi:hypothetical protein
MHDEWLDVADIYSLCAAHDEKPYLLQGLRGFAPPPEPLSAEDILCERYIKKRRAAGACWSDGENSLRWIVAIF